MRLPVLFLALLALAAAPAPAAPPQPRLVGVQNGPLRLKALLWVPRGCHHCPAILFNHGRSGTVDETIRQRAAQILGPIFARHGYVFLFVYRRGEGLSAGQGQFISDLLDREQRRRGQSARDRLQVRLLVTDQLSDGMAGIAFLRHRQPVNARRIAVVGHSFGGQLALLEAERDRSLRAVVAFGPAAVSWEGSPLLQHRLISAARAINAPVLLIHAANDYSTKPGRVLDSERARLGKSHALAIYPPVGHTAAEGHRFLYSKPSVWEADVFRFLDGHLRT
jgi:carboxymethylenebutenolidase